MLGFVEIANADLNDADLPASSDTWDLPLNQFAHSFDGYKHAWTLAHPAGKMPRDGEAIPVLARFAKPILQAWHENKTFPTDLSLGDLRACLFWLGRKRHWASGLEPEETARLRLACARDLVTAIAFKVLSNKGR